MNGYLRVPTLLVTMLWAAATAGCAVLRVDLTPDTGGPDSEWVIVDSDDDSSVVVQSQISSGLVSVKCSEDGCRALIIADASCDISGMFPVLINTTIDSGITEGQCVQAQDTHDSSIVRDVILLAEPNLLLPSIVRGDIVTTVIPLADGQVSVFRIPTNGLHELIAPRLPRIFDDPSDQFDEDGIELPPAPGYTDDFINT